MHESREVTPPRPDRAPLPRTGTTHIRKLHRQGGNLIYHVGDHKVTYKYIMLHTERCFRVGFRGWECSHSIRSEILHRPWSSDFFWKIIFSKNKKFRKMKTEKSKNFTTINSSQKKIGQKIFFGRTFFFRPIFFSDQICFRFFQKLFFSIDQKIFLKKSWEKNRTYISKQNLSAVRMGALPASESHSKA